MLPTFEGGPEIVMYHLLFPLRRALKSHNQSRGPAKNLEVNRKSELAHNFSITGHEHHDAHHQRGRDSIDHS